MTERVITFSDAAIAILDSMVVDPNATYDYDYLSGGFYWSDEFPPIGSADWGIVEHDCLYRSLIRVRRCITLGNESVVTIPLWQQMLNDAPDWPGLLPERRTGRIAKHLLVAERLADRCFDRLLAEYDSEP